MQNRSRDSKRLRNTNDNDVMEYSIDTEKYIVVRYTGIVIVSTLIFGIVLGIVDIGIGQLMDLIF